MTLLASGTSVPFSVDGLPIRLTTSEVCALLRISPKTLSRRRNAGLLNLHPVDRGAEDLYQAADVLRLLKVAPASEAQPEPLLDLPTWDNPNAEAVRRARTKLGRGLG